MATVNILDLSVRQTILKEIQGEENKKRKDEALRRFEIYKNNQKQFILQALVNEFSIKTVSDMRTLTSINLTQKIVDEKASIYKEAPERKFLSEGEELSEEEQKQVDELYEKGKINVAFKKANKYYKLNNDQIHMQVVPIDGVVTARVLLPFHLDVVTNAINPEKGEVYITSVYDKSRVIKASPTDIQGNQFTQVSDQSNQGIGDPDDYTKLRDSRYVWWSNELNFLTDGNGMILDDAGNMLGDKVDQAILMNPIGRLPFIDIAYNKDVEYWNRGGSNVVDFAIDFGVVMSDTVNINRLQGYAQGVVYAKEMPHQINVGPNQVMHIPLDPKSEIQPRFEFVSPKPDLNASLALLEVAVNFFLTSENCDIGTVSGKGDGKKYASGLERLLAMLDKFEASQDDKDAFKCAEYEVYKLIKEWSNIFQGVTKPTGHIPPLIPELQLAKLPEDSYVECNYKKPQAIQTQTDLEDSVIKRHEGGYITKVEAIMELRNVGEEAAKAIVKELAKDMAESLNNGEDSDDSGDDNWVDMDEEMGDMNNAREGDAARA